MLLGKRKDPGVPNTVPFKGKMILEAQLEKKAHEEAEENKKIQLRLRRKEEKLGLNIHNIG